MMLKYLKKPRSMQELRKRDYTEEGTYLYDNARPFIEEGFRTTILTANPLLFPPDVIGKLRTKQDFYAHLSRYRDPRIHDPKRISVVSRYLKAGGRINLGIPTLEPIRESIDAGFPVLALLFARALGRREGGYHFVVVSGYRPNAVHVTNVLDKSKRRAWFSNERFLYALHCGTTFDFDNGSLLFVRKR